MRLKLNVTKMENLPPENFPPIRYIIPQLWATDFERLLQALGTKQIDAVVLELLLKSCRLIRLETEI